MKISNFATDLDLEENGVWVDIGDGARLKLARVGNPAYTKLQRELAKPYRQQLRRNAMPAEKLLDIQLQLLSKTVLIDWEGLEDDKGKPIKPSVEHAYDLLKGLKDFRRLVEELADEQATFALIETEEAGNG